MLEIEMHNRFLQNILEVWSSGQLTWSSCDPVGPSLFLVFPSSSMASLVLLGSCHACAAMIEDSLFLVREICVLHTMCSRLCLWVRVYWRLRVFQLLSSSTRAYLLSLDVLLLVLLFTKCIVRFLTYVFYKASFSRCLLPLWLSRLPSCAYDCTRSFFVLRCRCRFRHPSCHLWLLFAGGSTNIWWPFLFERRSLPPLLRFNPSDYCAVVFWHFVLLSTSWSIQSRQIWGAYHYSAMVERYPMVINKRLTMCLNSKCTTIERFRKLWSERGVTDSILGSDLLLPIGIMCVAFGNVVLKLSGLLDETSERWP
jgi:hypothetical protein